MERYVQPPLNKPEETRHHDTPQQAYTADLWEEYILECNGRLRANLEQIQYTSNDMIAMIAGGVEPGESDTQ